MLVAAYESVKAHRMKKSVELTKKYESSACRIPITAKFVFGLLVALAFFGGATSIYARDQSVTARGATDGTVTNKHEKGFSLEVFGSSTLVNFEVPLSSTTDTTRSNQIARAASMIGRLREGDRVIVKWESRFGRRVPIGIDRLTDDAVEDASLTPVIASAEVIPRRLLTNRGGRFDIGPPLDPRLPGTETIVYDRVFNGVLGHRDIYRMYVDGRLPLCLTCFTEPRVRAVMGNPTIDPSNNLVVVQRLNENAAGDGNITEDLSWGVNHDLWVLNIETKEFRPIWQSPPGHAAAHPQFIGAAQVRFSERALPAEGEISSTHLTAFSLGRNQLDPWLNWHSHRVGVNAAQPASGRAQTLSDQSRVIAYGDLRPVYGIANDGVFQRIYGSDAVFRERLLDHGLIERPQRSEFSLPDRIGPALRDQSKRLWAYTSSRAIPTRQLADEHWQTPTDLFVRFGDGPLYQLTENAQRSRETGDVYQVVDLDWTRDRGILIAAIEARNPITRRAREAEIWRFDLKELITTPPTEPNQAAN